MPISSRLAAVLWFAVAAHATGCSYDYAGATRCSNGVRDGDESDVDCGGPCDRCAFGKSCARTSDCDETVARCELDRCTPLRLTAKWRRIVKGTPPPRAAAQLSFRGEHGVLTGGFQKQDDIKLHALGDMWVFNGNGAKQIWTNFDAMKPGPRFYHAQAFDPRTNAVILAGGVAVSEFSDTWALVDEQNWKSLKAMPASRSQIDMVFDTRNNRMVLYGESKPNQIWVRASSLDATTPWDVVMTVDAPPEAPIRHAMAYDEARGEMVVFGGCISSCTLATARTAILDLNVDPPKWRVLNLPGPIARWGAAMAYDSHRQRIVLFGGRSGDDTRYNDIYEWDGEAWTQIEPLEPGVEGESIPTRTYHPAFDYDEPERQMVLMAGGGYEFKTFSETWAYTVLGWPCANDEACGVGNRCVDNICCDGKCSTGCNNRNRPGTCERDL